MGLFDKQKCCICGKEGRLLGEYPSAFGTKYLCDDCEIKMNVSGLTSLGIDYDIKPTFEALQNYQKFYLETTDLLREKSKESLPIASSIGDIVINNYVVCFPEYMDFMISTDDVYAITYTDLPKYSNTFTDAFMVTIFTKNPALPYYSFIAAGKVSVFSLSIKSKKYREGLTSLFEAYCKNLKYPIGKAREVKKMVKKDESYDLPVYKEKLIEWLDKAEWTKGDFNPKKIDRKIPKMNWSIQYLTGCGYKFG